MEKMLTEHEGIFSFERNVSSVRGHNTIYGINSYTLSSGDLLKGQYKTETNRHIFAEMWKKKKKKMKSQS